MCWQLVALCDPDLLQMGSGRICGKLQPPWPLDKAVTCDQNEENNNKRKIGDPEKVETKNNYF